MACALLDDTWGNNVKYFACGEAIFLILLYIFSNWSKKILSVVFCCINSIKIKKKAKTVDILKS